MKSLEWLVDQLNQRALESGRAQGSRPVMRAALRLACSREADAAFAVASRIAAIRAAISSDANQALLELLDGDGS